MARSGRFTLRKADTVAEMQRMHQAATDVAKTAIEAGEKSVAQSVREPLRKPLPADGYRRDYRTKDAKFSGSPWHIQIAELATHIAKTTLLRRQSKARHTKWIDALRQKFFLPLMRAICENDKRRKKSPQPRVIKLGEGEYESPQILAGDRGGSWRREKLPKPTATLAEQANGKHICPEAIIHELAFEIAQGLEEP